MEYIIYHGLFPCCIECQIIELGLLNWNQFNETLSLNSENWTSLYNLIYKFNFQNRDSIYYNTFFLKKIVEKIFDSSKIQSNSLSPIIEIIELSTYIDKYLLYIELLINLFPIRSNSKSYYKSKKMYYKYILIREFSRVNYDIISKNITDKISNWMLNLDEDIHLNELSYLITSLSKLDLNSYIIPIIKTFESLYTLKSNTWDTNLLNPSLLKSLYLCIISYNNLVNSLFIDLLSEKNIELIITSCNTIFIKLIYHKNKDILNNVLQLAILNRNKNLLKNLYKLFRLKNNDCNHTELIDDIICDNLQHFFKENNINKALIYSQNFVYCITFIKPWPNDLDNKYDVCLKKNILLSKNFSNNVLNLIIDYNNSDKELSELIIPSTFSYIINYINDKQQFVDNLNYNITKKLFSFYYKNKSLYSKEYNKYKTTINFFENITKNSLVKNINYQIIKINTTIDDFKSKKYNPLIAYLQYNLYESITTKIKILSKPFWNINTDNFNIPNEVENSWNLIKYSFKRRYPSKVLTLSSKYSYIQIYDNYSNALLNLPLILGTILIEMSKSTENTFDRIQKKINISENYLISCLNCLTDKDIIYLNNSNYHIKSSLKDIDLYPWDINEIKETKKILQSNKKENNIILKALLVRIMKKNREMDIKKLENECKEKILREFSIDDKKINSIINLLIDEDYFERKENIILYVP